MAKKQKKRVNPRRIPLAKSEIDRDAILNEAMQDDMYHAWLLVVNAMIELQMVPINDIQIIADEVNLHTSKTSFGAAGKDSEINRAEVLMGISSPYSNLNPSGIKSAVELQAFKKKVYRVAIHTALCVLCLGLDSTGRLSHDELRALFFHADLTLAEIEHGINSYEKLAEGLSENMVSLEVMENDYCDVSLSTVVQN